MVTENINIVVTTRGAAVAARGITRIGRSSRVASVAVRALSVALVAVAGGATISALFRLSDAATQVGNRIRSVTATTEVAASVQNRLFEAASRTGATIEDTSRLFQRLTVGTRNLGVGTERVVKVVEGLNAALVVSGATSREASAALLQLGQGLASDNLSGEELRSLRENLPQLAQGLAAELDTTIGALKELGRQGRLTAREVFPAIERAVVSFQEKLETGEVVFTFGQALNAIRNEVIQFVAILQRATPATQTLTKAIFGFADGLAERLVLGLANAIRGSVGFFGAFEEGFGRIEDFLTGVQNAAKAVGIALGALGDIAILVLDALAAPFLSLRLKLAQTAAFINRIGNAVGLISDEAVAEQDQRVSRSAQNLTLVLGDIEKRAGAIGDAIAGRTQEGVESATRALTPFQQRLLDLADSFENAITVPEANTKDVVPDFFARAAENTERIVAERGDPVQDVPVDLAAGITESFQQGFAEAIKNGGDVFQLIGQNLEEAANNALVQGFQTAFNTAQGLLEEAFKSASKFLENELGPIFGGLGPVLGQALSGALQFVALQALSALFGGGGNDQTSSSGNVQSAVTSTQAVRGIVAGPTEVAIANVGRNIAEAIDPLLQETVVQTGILRIIAQNTQSGAAAVGGGASPASLLATSSAPVS